MRSKKDQSFRLKNKYIHVDTTSQHCKPGRLSGNLPERCKKWGQRTIVSNI